MNVRFVSARSASSGRNVLSSLRGVPTHLATTLHEPPVDERVVDERFEHGEDRFFVFAQDAHRVLAGDFERPFDARDFHRRGEHTREAERYLLRVFLWAASARCEFLRRKETALAVVPTHLALHRDFEAVTKVDVDDLSADTVHEQVRRVSIAQTEDVANHRHDGERAAVVAASVEPGFGIPTLEPEDSVKVLTSRVVERVLEDLELLDLHEVVEIGRHLLAEPVSTERKFSVNFSG